MACSMGCGYMWSRLGHSSGVSNYSSCLFTWYLLPPPHVHSYIHTHQVTSHVSIYFWRQRYTELLSFMRESGVTQEEADDDECIRLLAEWNGACACV